MRNFINLYFSAEAIRMTKSRRMTWAGQVACIKGMKDMFNILLANSEGKSYVGSP
jgi:hypothetical protein